MGSKHKESKHASVEKNVKRTKKRSRSPTDEGEPAWVLRPAMTNAPTAGGDAAITRTERREQAASRCASYSFHEEMLDLFTRLATDETGVALLHDAVPSWEPDKLTALCHALHPTHLGRLVAGWSGELVGQILRKREPNELIRIARELEPEDLVNVLPHIKGRHVSRILAALYFESKDPHLSGVETRNILERLDEASRLKKSTKGLDKELVRAVLRGEDPVGGAGDDSSYESSFVTSDEEDGLDDEAVEDSGGSRGSLEDY